MDLLQEIRTIPMGKIIPDEITIRIYNLDAKDLSWDIFDSLFEKENASRTGHFISAIVAQKLLDPKINKTVSEYFKGNFQYNASDIEDLGQNVYMEFISALDNFDNIKSKFPIYSQKYILSAIRNTFSFMSAYDEKKILEEITSKLLMEDKQLSQEEAVTRARLMVARPESLDHKDNEDDLSYADIIEADENIEKEFEKNEKKRHEEVMMNFFTLNADKNGKVDILESASLWFNLVGLFDKNDVLFEKFKQEVLKKFQQGLGDDVKDGEPNIPLELVKNDKEMEEETSTDNIETIEIDIE